MNDDITSHEALELIRKLRSPDWKLHHTPTGSTWGGPQVAVALGAVDRLPPLPEPVAAVAPPASSGRFLVFAGAEYYPNGGADDLKGERAFGSVTEALDWLREHNVRCDWLHVLDLQTMKIVHESR